MRRFYLLAAIVMVGVLSPRAAAACDCLQTTTCEGVLYYSGAIFVGRVVSVEDLKPSEHTQGSFDGRRVTFRVTERFFGAAEEVITVRTGMGGGDCGYPFVAGVTYLVYATKGMAGELATGICSRTQPAAGAGGDLKYLRDLLASPPAEARAFGRVMSAGKPFKGALVMGLAGDTLITAVSHADGKFELHGPPGEYRLKVEVPPGTNVTAPAEVRLFDSRGCGTIFVSVQVAKLR